MTQFDHALVNEDFRLPADADEALVQSVCEHLNTQYRAGAPIVNDDLYDTHFVAVLRRLNPNNPFLNTVEPESELGQGPLLRHSRPMLSTDKAYDAGSVARFIGRVEQAARELSLPRSTVTFRVTAKLDGMACRDEGQRLATRGNGFEGSDVTHILNRGAIIAGELRNQGDGEIVVVEDYFKSVLEPQFDIKHPRNYIAGFCASDTVKPHHAEAVKNRAIVVVPYYTLPSWTLTADELRDTWESLVEQTKASVPYRTDGTIVEVTNPLIKDHMGSTSHHHRWMLAIKAKGDTALTRVKSITWQTGRTGRVTPVVEVEPVECSGATISRVTAHHARIVESQGIGPGALLEIIRSGEVIPKIESIVEPAHGEGLVPTECPSCSGKLSWDSDYLVCTNQQTCPEQAVSRLFHFFSTLGNIDLFGPRSIRKLIAAGYRELTDIYSMSESDFESAGFGAGQSANLMRELKRSQNQEIEDWRFIAAFGINFLGRGDSRKLLTSFTVEEVAEGLSATQIATVRGFGEISGETIQHHLGQRRALIAEMLPKFTLRRTGKAAVPDKFAENSGRDSLISGKGVVFTGALQSGSREAMQEKARTLGAKVQSSVSGATDYLVCGEKVGASKIAKAEKHGVRVISESDYLKLIS